MKNVKFKQVGNENEDADNDNDDNYLKINN